MVKVAKSTVHGKGVFATEFIPKGTILKCDVLLIDKSLSWNLFQYEYPW